MNTNTITNEDRTTDESVTVEQHGNIKMDVAGKIAAELAKKGIINEYDMKSVKDCMMTVLYDYSVFHIVHTEIVASDFEEFRELCEFYITKKYIAGNKKASIETVIYEMKKFYKFIKKKITETTTEDIDMYLLQRGMSKTCSRSYLQSIRLDLSSFFTLLYKNNRIAHNPIDGVEPIKVEVKYETPLSKTEMTKLEDACKTYKEKAILSLLLETGLRASELCHLNLDDMDFQNLDLFVHLGKGGKDRIVPFGEKSSHLIQQYLIHERDDVDTSAITVPIATPLFNKPSKRNPNEIKPMDGAYLEAIINDLGARSGVLRVHPHLLRKTYATNLYKQGIGLNIIAKLLGHSNLDSIHRYVVINDSDVKDVLNGVGIF